MEFVYVLELSACRIGLCVDDLRVVPGPRFSRRTAVRRRNPLPIKDFGVDVGFRRREAEKCREEKNISVAAKRETPNLPNPHTLAPPAPEPFVSPLPASPAGSRACGEDTSRISRILARQLSTASSRWSRFGGPASPARPRSPSTRQSPLPEPRFIVHRQGVAEGDFVFGQAQIHSRGGSRPSRPASRISSSMISCVAMARLW